MALNPEKALFFEVSSGNIFADIELANPKEELTKAELAW